jgi:hypothetical protein
MTITFANSPTEKKDEEQKTFYDLLMRLYVKALKSLYTRVGYKVVATLL